MIIKMEVYCLECSFKYKDENQIPEDEEVLKIQCGCGKLIIIHRCEKNKYSRMSVREVKI